MKLQILDNSLIVAMVLILPCDSLATQEAHLGISMARLTQELCDEWDAGDVSDIENGLIIGVVKGSPADIAGLKTGDVLIELGDHPIYLPSDVLHVVQYASPSDDFVAKVLRKREEVTVTGKYGGRTHEEVPPNTHSADSDDWQILQIASSESGYVDVGNNDSSSHFATYPGGCKLAHVVFQPNIYPPDRPPAGDLVVEAICEKSSAESGWTCTIKEKRNADVDVRDLQGCLS